jgi:hypothetical protein
LVSKVQILRILKDEHFRNLLKRIGPGKMSSTAYDTAWVARIRWFMGCDQPFYYHDRVICTLSAMIALTHRGRRAHDRLQIEKGLQALERITSGATQDWHLIQMEPL